MNKIYFEPLYNFSAKYDELKIYNTYIYNRDKLKEILEINTSEENFDTLVEWVEQDKTADYFLYTKSKLSIIDIRSEFDDIISLLALSYSIYDLRSTNRDMPSLKLTSLNRHSNYIIDLDKENVRSSWNKTGSLQPMYFDERWEKFNKKFFWFDLLKIINNKTSINKNWKNKLHNACILAGKSQRTNDCSFAFLLNIIALEILLTENNDKESEAIPRRMNYILGWFDDWLTIDFPKKISELYKKRCSLVHEGGFSNITFEDLVLLDELVFNILNNLIKLSDSIQGITDLEKLIKKSEAYELLREELSNKIPVKHNFMYTRRRYSVEQLKKLHIFN